MALEWPAPMGDAAYQGLAGEFVRTIEPHTEADPAAILVQLLVAFGNACNRRPHFQIEGSRHPAALYALVVGETAKARKGSSWGRVQEPLALAREDWARDCIAYGGLASGEGLIYQVRDPDRTRRKAKNDEERKRADSEGYVEDEVDAGAEDKRLLVLQDEFGQALRVMGRDGNTLSGIIRTFWDRGKAKSMVKNAPLKASDAHVSIIGHITQDELSQELTRTESYNGFANRFLWVCAKRSKFLPYGGDLSAEQVEALGRRLADTLSIAAARDEMKLDAAAHEQWGEKYPALSEGESGLLGAVTSRAEAQARRVAMVYALLDGAAEIGAPHLDAALEVWRYSLDSARYLFGGRLGNPMADRFLAALVDAGAVGLTRLELRNRCAPKATAGEIDAALGLLVDRKLVVKRSDPSKGGRPAEHYYSTGNKGKKGKESA